MQNSVSQLGVLMTSRPHPLGYLRMFGDIFGGHSCRDVTGIQWIETYHAQDSPTQQKIIQSKCQQC